jgi:sugar lactone lactonase YvrE
VALDPSGNLFIADTNNCSIRMIDPAGVITTVAGNGTVGSSGDGGPATGAQLGYPSGVALDASGNLFIADAGNNRIRKVDSGGTITTIAGVGTTGFSGDGGPASSAQLNNPSGVVLDATGNLFIADSGNNRIRVVEASTPTCTGDCNHDDRVAVNELILGVNIALGRQQLAACPEFDENTQEGVEINELITAVDNALNGCGAPWWRLVAVLGLLEARGRFGRRG